MPRKTKTKPNDFAYILGIRTDLGDKKTKKFVQTRLVQLGLGKECGRCGGCGQYSYNPRTGTRCFGCGGSGKVVQKLTVALFDQAFLLVEDGSNAKVQESNKRRRAVKALRAEVDAEHSRLCAFIHWDLEGYRAGNIVDVHNHDLSGKKNTAERLFTKAFYEWDFISRKGALEAIEGATNVIHDLHRETMSAFKKCENLAITDQASKLREMV